VRGWFGKIAANILRNLLKNHATEHAQDEEAWERILETVEGSKSNDEHDTPELNTKRKLIAEALETLTEREQLVLRTTYQYYRIGEKFQRLPNKISHELAEQLATTPENLRKIRERALKNIRDYVNEHQK
jgi:RNA polymerase sigma factor (sigma-70 family)